MTTALDIQQIGRVLRSPMWHLERQDPCDQMPDAVVSYLWEAVARERGDTMLVGAIRMVRNSRVGKLGL